jgi:hypothetical protein
VVDTSHLAGEEPDAPMTQYRRVAIAEARSLMHLIEVHVGNHPALLEMVAADTYQAFAAAKLALTWLPDSLDLPRLKRDLRVAASLENKMARDAFTFFAHFQMQGRIQSRLRAIEYLASDASGDLLPGNHMRGCRRYLRELADRLDEAGRPESRARVVKLVAKRKQSKGT